MRRRLWWHLLNRDARAGEDHGLESAKDLAPVSKARLPLNINDSDLYPDMEDLPSPRTGWTSMTFSLINVELILAIQKLAAAAASSSLSEDVRIRIVNGTKAWIEERLQHCNPVIPIQRQTIHCSRHLVRKLEFVTRQQCCFLRNRGGSCADFATDENLLEALEILEPRLFYQDELLKQFAWASKAYPQYNIIMYVLWHLRLKPEGLYVDRAWTVTDAFFARELGHDLAEGVSSKSAVLAVLRAKALSFRRKEQTTDSVENTEDKLRRPGSESKEALLEDEFMSAYLRGDTGFDEFDFDSIGAEWSDWDALMQDFQHGG